MGYLMGSCSIISTSDFRTHVNREICDDIEIQQVNCRSKFGFKGVFSKDRKLSFKMLLALIMTSKSSIQRELDQIFQMAGNTQIPLWVFSKSTFTQARAKMDPQTFVYLNKTACRAFYQSADFNTWSWMRLLGIDGSTLALPHHST